MSEISTSTLRRHYEQAAGGKEAGEAFYNLPPFLGMSKHVDEDRSFLLDAALQHPRSGLDAEAFRTVRDFLVRRGHVAGEAAGQLAQVPE